MTREKFIDKYLGNADYEYCEEHKDQMRDDLDKVIAYAKDSKSTEAAKYFISVLDEVTGKIWRERPDHVAQKFLEAEKEYTTQ